VRGLENLMSLDVSYNGLRGDPAYALLQGVYTNGQNEGELRDLNLGWNCLGEGAAHGRVTRMLSSVLNDCKSLFHLDISYNHFSAEDCDLLADGIRKNHSLWGVHIEGNKAMIDADGFICVFQEEGVMVTEQAPRSRAATPDK
ncbi:unnamed protein product, partial [Prorocentrum cordatum]